MLLTEGNAEGKDFTFAGRKSHWSVVSGHLSIIISFFGEK
jgi:hypothetical protein